ncbi:hypothetical protein J7F03_11945 [Streptomyces sp. ISL-43]|nr:hypothetical protein [Streptomyces sp. ISL-43]
MQAIKLNPPGDREVEILPRIDLTSGRPVGIATHPAGRRLYVTSPTDGKMSTYTVKLTGEPDTSVPPQPMNLTIAQPHGITVHPNRGTWCATGPPWAFSEVAARGGRGRRDGGPFDERWPDLGAQRPAAGVGEA